MVLKENYNHHILRYTVKTIDWFENDTSSSLIFKSSQLTFRNILEKCEYTFLCCLPLEYTFCLNKQKISV